MSNIPIQPEIVAVTRPDGTIDIIGRDVNGERVLVTDYQLGDEIRWMADMPEGVISLLDAES